MNNGRILSTITSLLVNAKGSLTGPYEVTWEVAYRHIQCIRLSITCNTAWAVYKYNEPSTEVIRKCEILVEKAKRIVRRVTTVEGRKLLYILKLSPHLRSRVMHATYGRKKYYSGFDKYIVVTDEEMIAINLRIAKEKLLKAEKKAACLLRRAQIIKAIAKCPDTNGQSVGGRLTCVESDEEEWYEESDDMFDGL